MRSRDSAAEAVDEAITSRRSVRAFRPDPVPQGVVEHLLQVASRAPSGTNMQPWRVHAFAGADKERLSAALRRQHSASQDGPPQAEYRYYPTPFPEPYLARRREVGWDLYGLLGIEKGDSARMHDQHGRNLLFFDAPVGLLFTVDRRLEIGSWLDYGMFLQNVMTAARGRGLDTCVQAAFAPFHETIRTETGIGPDEIVVCGMSLGYADESAAENRLVTRRVPARDFATFRGFADT